MIGDIILFMQEFIRFMNVNQGWVGSIIGTASFVLALFLYWRSRISGIIACQSRDVPMIGGDDAVFPAEVEVRYRETRVPRLISSTVWIWNAGKKTVRGTDIVAHDPLRFCFSGEILNVRIKKVSREVVRITADTSEKVRRTVCFGFEFLDPGDAGVFEVLHTGSDREAQYWGRAWGTATSSKLGRFNRTLIRLALAALPLFFFLGILLGENVGEPNEDPPIVQVGVVCVSLSAWVAYRMWRIRRRVPSSLVGNIDEGENDRTAVSTSGST